MNPLGRLRRAPGHPGGPGAPWLSGALLLLLSVGLVAPAAWALGLRRWPFYVGLLAALLLLQGSLERLWQRRATTRPPKARRRFRVVPGRKGNGKSYDLAADDSTDKQRWPM